MTDFEADVLQRLARIEERTHGLDKLGQDVAAIKTRVGLLEFKSSAFGLVGGALVLVIKHLFGR